MKALYCHVTVKDYLSNNLWKFLIKIESTWRRDIKEQAPQLTLLYRGRTVRSSHRRYSIKKVVLKNFAISTENVYVGVSFLKSCRSEGVHFYEKETPTQVFSCEYCEVFKASCFEKYLRPTAFNFLNGSLLHGPKG